MPINQKSNHVGTLLDNSWYYCGIYFIQCVYWVTFFLFVFFCTISNGQDIDKSGMRPTVLSLPSGPGSIEGLGGSFNPNYVTGTFSYSIALKVPPGRNGMAPDLKIAYNAGYGNGLFGLGWRLDTPFITRLSPNRLPLYKDYPTTNGIDIDHDGVADDVSEYDTFTYEGNEELVPTVDGYWRIQHEGPFLRFQRDSGGGWKAVRKDGVELTFGMIPASRIQDSQGRIFSWFLDSMSDTHGNQILFQYGKLDNTCQVYPTNILYNETGQMSVHFNYEQRPDPISNGRATYETDVFFRCSSIDTLVNSNVIRSYKFAYSPTNGLQQVSTLSSVLEISGDGTTSLPAEMFSYSVFSPTNVSLVILTNAPFIDLSNPNIQLVDINGDALPDILDTSMQPHSYYLNLGVGQDGSVHWSERQYMQTNVGVYLEDSTSELADMEGRGRPNLVSLFGGNNPELFSINENLEWESKGTMSNASFSLADPNVRLVDANGDRLIDAMETSDGDILTWVNINATSWSSPFVAASPDLSLRFDQPTTRLADMNGDGMMDLIYLDSEICYYYMGMGYGQFGTRVNMRNSPAAVNDPTRLFLMDVNGDGLVDIVQVENDIRIYLNKGLDPGSTNSGSFADPIIVASPYVNSFTIVRSADMDGNGVRDIVLNVDVGNGPQLAYISLSGQEHPNQLKQISNGIGMTTTVGYESSVSERVRDETLGKAWPDAVPLPISIVNTVRKDSTFQQSLKTMHYHNGYYDFIKEQFRGFSRAESTDKGDSSIPNLVTCYQYDVGKTNEALKGKLLVEEAGIGSDTSVWPEYGTNGNGAPTALDIPFLHYRVQTDWQIQTVANSATNDPRLITFTAPTNRVRQIYELGSGSNATVTERFQYDAYGNMTSHAELGRTSELPASQRVTTTSYSASFPSGIANWLLDRLVTEAVRDGDGIMASQHFNFYDDTQTLGLVSKGDLTETLSWVATNHFAVTLNKKYDQYGNVVDVYDPLYGQSPGHYREIQFDPAFHTFPIQEKIHTGGTLVESLVAAMAYDVRFGVPTNFVDFNNNMQKFAYDPLGRLVGVTKPPDTNDTVEYSYVLGVTMPGGKIVNWLETRSKDESQASGFTLARTFYDGAGDKLMTKLQAEPASGSSQPRAVVSQAVTLGARNEPNFILSPCFSANGGDVAAVMAFEDISAPNWSGLFVQGSNLVQLSCQAAPFTTITYDALIRTLSTTNADKSYRRMIYSPLQEQDFDENQNDSTSVYFNASRVRHLDGLGRFVRLDEKTRLNDDGSMGSTIHGLSTMYSYDLNNNVVNITDSQGNQKTQQFDGLRRKVFLNDPDRGTMQYAYDDASNLTGATDAKGQLISYNYDGANRVLSETYGPSATPPAVVYHYDVPFPNVSIGNGTTTNCLNTLGRIAWISDLSGEEHNSYDVRGRVAFVIKRLPDAQFYAQGAGISLGMLVNYRTGYSYDSQDRITSVTYPDDDQVSYMWNERGLLKRIPTCSAADLISSISYAPSGKMTVEAYGNGVQSQYAYDSRQRLSELVAVSVSNVLVHFKYDFDPASNIKMIEDLRSVSYILPGDSRRNTQVFGYDDLYRLTSVGYMRGGPGTTNLDGGTINYSYDRIGDMLSQSSSIADLDPAIGLPTVNLGTMTSGGSSGRFNRIGRGPDDPPGPHALTSIINASYPARSYLYDANGNMTVVDGITNGWDPKDRLISARSKQMTATYLYDYAGKRVMKIVQPTGSNSVPTAVVYVNKFFEVRENDAPTKYVWNGNARVARATGSICGNQTVQRIRLWPGMNLVSVAVSGAKLPLASNAVVAAYTWQPSASSWQVLSASAPIAAGTVLWLEANTNTTIAITGSYFTPTNTMLPPGPAFIGGTGLEPLVLTNGGLTGISNQWHYDPINQSWQIAISALTNKPSFPSVLPPGEVLFVRVDGQSSIPSADPTLRIRYYLNDHLSSTAAMVDSSGALIEESAMYPFGRTRNHFSLRGSLEPYSFIQKELDSETQLHYFDSRYLNSESGRFINVDPIAKSLTLSLLEDPQNLNEYAYAKNRPLIYVDRDGQFAQLFWGAALGFGFDLASQVLPEIMNHQPIKVDPFELVIAISVGALTGGASTLTESFAAKGVGQALISGAAVNGVGGVVQEASKQLEQRGTINDLKKVGIEGLKEGAIAGVAGGAGKTAGEFFKDAQLNQISKIDSTLAADQKMTSAVSQAGDKVGGFTESAVENTLEGAKTGGDAVSPQEQTQTSEEAPTQQQQPTVSDGGDD